jgi:DNA-directed RNA polymerase specialized sigma24 family protein
MTETRQEGAGGASAEARAQELLAKVGGDVARFATRVVARAREEVEDIVAEAQALRHGDGGHGGA